MPTLAELVTLRDALLEARLSGERVVRFLDGCSIQYASDAEFATALAAADRAIATAQGVRPVSSIRFSTSKGL